jgi:Uncharacterized conserved protein
MAVVRFDLAAIESALRLVQSRFGEINALLNSRRDYLEDCVIERMLCGYAFVDRALGAGIDFFANGNSHHLLELNAIVLCGTDAAEREASIGHLQATEQRFYDDFRGGIRDIVEWHAQHRDESAWKRAAGVYVRAISRPQLFIEGNHRTGALIMSYLLARDGKPPFVLTVDNAKAYFDPSTVITKTRKHSVAMLYRMPRIKSSFADFLKDQASKRFLRNGEGGDVSVAERATASVSYARD